jgi:hypothetical protein
MKSKGEIPKSPDRHENGNACNVVENNKYKFHAIRFVLDEI